MSIEQQNRIAALEQKLEALEARIGVLERAESYAQSEVVLPRRPGRPRKEENGEAYRR